jgi:hypothetical protein
LHRANFTTLERWAVEGTHGAEGQDFLIAEGRPRNASGFEVIVEVAELVWEPLQ